MRFTCHYSLTLNTGTNYLVTIQRGFCGLLWQYSHSLRTCGPTSSHPSSLLASSPTYDEGKIFNILFSLSQVLSYLDGEGMNDFINVSIHSSVHSNLKCVGLDLSARPVIHISSRLEGETFCCDYTPSSIISSSILVLSIRHEYRQHLCSVERNACCCNNTWTEMHIGENNMCASNPSGL